jgi:hypothetical protein
MGGLTTTFAHLTLQWMSCPRTTSFAWTVRALAPRSIDDAAITDVRLRHHIDVDECGRPQSLPDTRIAVARRANPAPAAPPPDKKSARALNARGRRGRVGVGQFVMPLLDSQLMT